MPWIINNPEWPDGDGEYLVWTDASDDSELVEGPDRYVRLGDVVEVLRDAASTSTDTRSEAIRWSADFLEYTFGVAALHGKAGS